MRGTVAKRIRREVFGDHSHRGTQYEGTGKKFRYVGKRRKGFFGRAMDKVKELLDTHNVAMTGTVRCVGLRRVYKKAKKAYKMARQGE